MIWISRLFPPLWTLSPLIWVRPNQLTPRWKSEAAPVSHPWNNNRQWHGLRRRSLQMTPGGFFPLHHACSINQNYRCASLFLLMPFSKAMDRCSLRCSLNPRFPAHCKTAPVPPKLFLEAGSLSDLSAGSVVGPVAGPAAGSAGLAAPGLEISCHPCRRTSIAEVSLNKSRVELLLARADLRQGLSAGVTWNHVFVPARYLHHQAAQQPRLNQPLAGPDPPEATSEAPRDPAKRPYLVPLEALELIERPGAG